MLWGTFLLFCAAKSMAQNDVILSPEFNVVLENTSLELTCHPPNKAREINWRILKKEYSFSTVKFKEGACVTDAFLNESKYFETKCLGDYTFKVKIKRVDISYHGQEWICSYRFADSNSALINVQVPIKYVSFKDIDGDIIKTVEKIKTSLTCETSEGRPAANITWTKVSKQGTTDITHEKTYAVTRKEKLTERNLTIVRSSIDIEPVREDNGTRIICEARNRESYEVRKEITIHVQYPPRRPIFTVDQRDLTDSVQFISGENVSVLCNGDSYPYPTYHWNSTGRFEYKGQYLNISTLVRSDTWQCTITNNMTLPNKTTISGKSSGKLKILLLFPPTKPVLTWGGEGNHTVNEILYAIRNDDVTILCHSNGEPAPHYKWIGHSAGNKLHMAAIQTHTRKTCKASNFMRETFREERASSANTTVSIIVSYPPETPYLVLKRHTENTQFLRNRNKVIIKESNTVTVTCKADGYPSPVITWNNQDDRKSPDLTFKNVTKDSIGVYTCYAENAIKRSFPAYDDKRKTSTDLEIDVLYKSKIEMFYIIGNEKKEITEVKENETILFNCSVDSNPESEIVLFFSGNELLRNISTKTLIHSHKVNSCLDNGVYRCEGKNKYNSKPSSKELRLSVRCTPLKSPDFDMETNVSSAQNVTITFHFKAIAYPMTNFHWLKLSGTSWKNLTSCNKFKIKTVDYNSNLTISSITEMDYGCYKLRIQNDVGSLEQLFFLKPNGKPDPPTMFQHLTEYVKETSAILQWIPGFDGGPDQTFILRYKLHLGSDWVNVSIPHDGGKTMNYTLNGLESGSVYYAELFAENTEGKSMTLNHTFKTKEKSLPEWIYLIYSCGGVILIVVGLVVTMFSRKRLKQRSSCTAIYQNVPFNAPEANNVYQNLPFTSSGAASVEYAILTRKPVVNESHEMKEILQEHNISVHQNTRKNIFVSVPQNQNENKVYVPQNEKDLDLEVEPFSEPTEYYNTLEMINKLEKIKVSELYDYVKDRTDESFSVDFQKIPTALQMPCTFARKPENIALNRYRGILPYDHTRVRIDGQPDFFINASYIDGFKEPKEYIACLGPTATTHDNFKTFWKMVWHEMSELIVMVTYLNEPSGMKCEQYWPDPSQDEMYGDILVSCQKVEMFAVYTIRRFEVTRTTNAEAFCRRLVHLHYTAWPDKKTPKDVMTLLEFRQIYTHIRTTVNGPVIVHCSAGIGRTGVFIAIDRLIMEGKNEGSVNVVACITKMREQRVKMVQTCEQFKFIFKALAYALIFDCEPIPIENMKEQIAKSDKRSFIRKYKELDLSLERKSKEQIEAIAKNMSHNEKNRQGADIPDNNNRVYLYLNRGFKESDYINAVFINSYKCKDHFIMAQSPLLGTESDFLTMIYQENCFCVVSMEDFTEHGMKIGKYLLKEKQSLKVGGFTVSCFICDSKPQYIVRKVTINNKEEFSSGEQDFYHFQYKKWSGESDTPKSAEEFVEFVKDVQEYEKLGEESSHVLVHCLKANERSGLFCAIAIIIEKLLFDEQVSVMNTLRHLRTRRSSAITSMEQLKFCYKAALVIAQTQNKEIYVNHSVMM